MSDYKVNDTGPAGECGPLDEAPPWALGVYAALVAAIILATVVGNGLVLLLVLRYKRLRCRTVMISLSVVVADLLFALTFHLPILVSSVLRRWPFADAGCLAFGYLGLDFLVTRWLIMGVLASDRFCTVRFPFSYQKYSKWVLFGLTAIAWVLPTLLTVPSLDGLFNNSFRTNLGTCLPDCHGNDKKRLCQLYFTGYLSLSFIFGGLLPIFLYIWLYRRARKLRPSALTLGAMTIQASGGVVIRQPVAHVGDIRRDFRALFTFIIIFVTFLVTGLPAYVLQVVRAATSPAVICSIPELASYLVYALLLSATALDPLVIMRDQDFRRCLKDLLCCCSHWASRVHTAQLSRLPSDGTGLAAAAAGDTAEVRPQAEVEGDPAEPSNGGSAGQPSAPLQLFTIEQGQGDHTATDL